MVYGFMFTQLCSKPKTFGCVVGEGYVVVACPTVRFACGLLVSVC